MKSIKTKLFSGYSIILFIVLTLLSYISIEVLKAQYNKQNKDKIIQLEHTIINFISLNTQNKIKNLEKYIDIEHEFVIISKNKKIIFSNETVKKTDAIIEEIYEENFKLKEFFYADEFLVFSNKVGTYTIYIGVDDDLVNEYALNLATIIVVLNLIVYILLLVIGYILINKTIKPLKNILEQLQILRSAKSLSKRLQTINTHDEFEELISSLNEMLENIENSVENIKQFSSDASHELRTPLTVIQGEIELCKKISMSKEELQKSIDKIDIEQKKLQEIIKDFLLLARLDKEVLKPTNCSLDKVIFESIEQNIEKIEAKNLELIFDIEDDIQIKFNEKYLFIVINNLLANAIKYTKSGYIKLIAKNKNEKIYFKIEDSGIGIKKDDLEKIFNRFYRVDKTRSNFKDGVGIGLSIVKKICDSFSAKLECQSKIDEGSSFKIVFK